MDFIFVPLVVGVITLGIYKFFELLVCRRERRMIIDKMDGNALIDYLKFVPMGVRIGAPVSVRPVSGGVSGTLKAGCLLLGIGFGLLFAFMLLNWCAYDASYEMRSIVYGGSVLCFGGVGSFRSSSSAISSAGSANNPAFPDGKRSIPLLGGYSFWFFRGPCGAPGAGRFAGARTPAVCRPGGLIPSAGYAPRSRLPTPVRDGRCRSFPRLRRSGRGRISSAGSP